MLAALRSLKVHLRSNWSSTKLVSEDVYTLPHLKKCTPPFTNVFSWPKQKPCNIVDICGDETLRIDTSSSLCIDYEIAPWHGNPVSSTRIMWRKVSWDFSYRKKFDVKIAMLSESPCRGPRLKPKRTTNLYQWQIRSVLVRLLKICSHGKVKDNFPWM